MRTEAQIATRVLDWEWREVGFYWDKGHELYLVPAERIQSVYNTTSGSWHWLDGNRNRRVWDDMPQWSRDIAAAFEVVEKLRAQHSFVLDAKKGSDSGLWFASFGTHTALERTAPLAICVAALKAVK